MERISSCLTILSVSVTALSNKSNEKLGDQAMRLKIAKTMTIYWRNHEKLWNSHQQGFGWFRDIGWSLARLKINEIFKSSDFPKFFTATLESGLVKSHHFSPGWWKVMFMHHGGDFVPEDRGKNWFFASLVKNDEILIAEVIKVYRVFLHHKLAFVARSNF